MKYKQNAAVCLVFPPNLFYFNRQQKMLPVKTKTLKNKIKHAMIYFTHLEKERKEITTCFNP